MIRVGRILFCFLSLICVLLLLPSAVVAQQNGTDSSPNQLVGILAARGVLSTADVAKIRQAANSIQAGQVLDDLLLQKGLISAADYTRLTHQPVPAAKPAATSTQPSSDPPRDSPRHIAAVNDPPDPAQSRPGAAPRSALMGAAPQVPPHATEPGAPSTVERVPSKTINEALVPIRPFPVGGLKRGEVHAAFTADGVGILPYGFVKVTSVQDSSSPNGDDFPLPGFLTDTGPNGAPEFHVKARSSRFGANFEWNDANPKWVITGKIEADFEGNFNRSDNRNLSSVRSSNPSLRLAWGRMDYHFDSHNSFSALFGQDWTTFGSSTLPNILETTGLGIDFGALWERDPQMRVGFTHKATALALMSEFAIDLPGSGLAPSASYLYEQLGYGERQGPDSARPNLQARVVGQWQLDHAQGVPPAQIILSGFDGRRTAIVLASAVPTSYRSTFSRGISTGSRQDGWDAEAQLPTRWFTLIGKFYSGSDLRWFFAGQLYSYFNDTRGLTQTAEATAEDGSSAVVLGTNAQGQQVVAPERPVRALGGFVQVGLPLSRIFNANPAGRNAGWSLYGLYGEDQARARDIDRIAGTRHASDMIVGTLNYRFSRWISFSYEQSLYTTHANPEEPLPLFRGVRSREWNDVREEGGPIFTF